MTPPAFTFSYSLQFQKDTKRALRRGVKKQTLKSFLKELAIVVAAMPPDIYNDYQEIWITPRELLIYRARLCHLHLERIIPYDCPPA